jgi:putative addiction module component (TIGR02574 family)
MSSIQKLESEVLSLPEEQRLALANRILASIDVFDSQNFEAAWTEEIQKRMQEYERDTSKGLSAKSVFEKLDEHLKKCRT